MSTTGTALSAMPVMTRRVRAYFAPVDRVHGQTTIFDPSINGAFDLEAPPAPWVDLGWIEGFTRTSESTVAALAAGTPAVTQMQARRQVDATVSFRFKVWSKLSMALSAGSQHMNLLAAGSGGANGSGSKGAAAVNLAAGSTATLLSMAPSDAAQFSAGQMVAVDVDYAGATGYVGSAVSGAYVRDASDVGSDPDYARRVTFNVARIAAVSASGLALAQPLLAGAPVDGMRVQQVLGFVDREGGSFFQEWSALFVMPGEQGERVMFHYPRLQALTGAKEAAEVLCAPIERLSLPGNFRALPVTDQNDSERVVCFRSFLPGAFTLL